MNKSEKNLMTRRKLLLITDVTSLIIYAIMYLYIKRLEENKCFCSQNKQALFIKYATVSMSILLIISIFFPSFFRNNIVKFLFNVLNMGVILVLFIYIRELKKDSCECAIEKNEYTYEFLRIYSLISFYIIIFIFVVFISAIIGYFEFPKYGKFDVKQFTRIVKNNKTTNRKNGLF